MRTAAQALDRGLEGLTLEAVTGRDETKTRAAVARLKRPVDVVTPQELACRCDIFVECTPAAAFMSIAVPVLEAGRTLVTVSAAAILQHPEVIALGTRHHERFVLETGVSTRASMPSALPHLRHD